MTVEELLKKHRDQQRLDIVRTPSSDCPYCQAGTHHMNMTADERAKYHPLMGTGVDNFGLRRKEKSA